MKTQFSKHLTNVGVYALTYLRSMDTLRYITASASWVNTIMDSNPTVLFIGKKSGLNPVEKVAHINPIRARDRLYYKSQQRRFYERLEELRNLERFSLDPKR